MKKIIKILNKLYKKDDNKIAFSSYPDFSGNSKAMYDYISKNTDYNCNWITFDKGRKENHFNRKSIKGIKHLLNSKTIFTTHNSFLNIRSKNQNYINLWHGMPLKKMSYMEDDFDIKKLDYNMNNVTYFISTSILMKSLLSSCFNLAANKIIITGQPRNDYLFQKKSLSKNKLEKVTGLDLNKYEKVVFYLPTFRKGYSKKNEGEGIKDINFLRFDNFNFNYFIEFLEDNKILFIMKMHPFEEKYYLERLKKINSEYLKILPQNNLTSNFIDLYEVLGYSDLLITDYSSVYFDYIMMDKPVLFVPTDINEYSKKRGFLLEPYDFWTPGPKVYNEKDFYKAILQIFTKEEIFKKERDLINSMVNLYLDDRSSERVWDYTCDLLL